MEPTKEEIEKVIKEYEEYAKKNNFRLNPNRTIVENIVKALLKKEKLNGCRYCPCRVMTGDSEKDKKIICPCAYHTSEVKDKGQCICRLFVK